MGSEHELNPRPLMINQHANMLTNWLKVRAAGQVAPFVMRLYDVNVQQYNDVTEWRSDFQSVKHFWTGVTSYEIE